MREVDIRFEIEDDADAKGLIEAVGENLDYVHSGVELKNDGFGRLLPDKATEVKFVV